MLFVRVLLFDGEQMRKCDDYNDGYNFEGASMDSLTSGVGGGLYFSVFRISGFVLEILCGLSCSSGTTSIDDSVFWRYALYVVFADWRAVSDENCLLYGIVLGDFGGDNLLSFLDEDEPMVELDSFSNL